LRGCPDAVRPRGAGDEVAFPWVGVLATPTPPVDTRIVEFGVPCSGECGGELRLPGEDASLASMAKNTETWPNARHAVQLVPKTICQRKCIWFKSPEL
jgi:hypothetical protein